MVRSYGFSYGFLRVVRSYGFSYGFPYSQFFIGHQGASHQKLDIGMLGINGKIYPLVMTNSSPWKIHPFLIGKPFINGPSIYTMAMLNNQRV